MAVRDSSSARKPSYWAAVIVGSIVLVWILVEAMFSGVTANLAEAGDTVATHATGLFAAITSILGGIMALRNFTPGGDNELKPQGYEQGM